MAILGVALRCPRCTSLYDIFGGEPDSDVCMRPDCRGILERLTDADAAAAFRAAFNAHDLLASRAFFAATVTAEKP